MKRQIFCALLCLCLLLSGCTEGRKAEVSSLPAASSGGTASEGMAEAADYRESVEERQLSQGGSDFSGWVSDYLAYQYPGETASWTSRLSGGYLPALAGEPEIVLETWAASLSGHAEPVEVTLVMVRREEEYLLTGAFDQTNNPLDPKDSRDVYRYVREDRRFAEAVSMLPQNVLPEGMRSLNLDLLLPEYGDMQCISAGLSNSEAALLYYRQTEGENPSLSRLVAVLLDLDTGEKRWERELKPEPGSAIGDYDFSAEDGRLRVRWTGNGVEKLFELAADGTAGEARERPAGRVYSDDGRYYGYRDGETNDLWLVDTETGEERRLMEGTAGEALDVRAGSIAGIEQGKAVYTIFGYEWTIGYGVYEIATGQNTVRENGRSVRCLSDGRIHLTEGWALSSYRYVELSDPALSEKEIPGISGLFSETKNAEFTLWPVEGKDRLLLSAGIYDGGGGYAPESRFWFFDAGSGELLREEEAWIYDASLQGVSSMAEDTLFFYSHRLYGMGRQLFYMEI